MKWLLLLFIVIVLLLVFALVRRVQSGSNTYQQRHPVTEGDSAPAATEQRATEHRATEPAPAAEEGWDEAVAPPETPAAGSPPAAGVTSPGSKPAGEPWSQTPPTDEQGAEVADPSSLASSGNLDSEIAELEGERPDPDQRGN